MYRTSGIDVVNGEIVPDALVVYIDKNVAFTDAMIGVIARKNHISYLASFAKKHINRLADLGIKRI